MALVPQPIEQGGHMQAHATGNLRDEHRRGGCYRWRSSAATFVAQFTNLFPRSPGKMRLQTLTFEGDLAEAESIAPFAF